MLLLRITGYLLWLGSIQISQSRTQHGISDPGEAPVRYVSILPGLPRMPFDSVPVGVSRVWPVVLS